MTKAGNGPLDDTCSKRVEGGDNVQLQVTSPLGTHQFHVAALALQVHSASAPPFSGILPGLQLDHADVLLVIPGVPAAGWSLNLALPAGLSGMFRWQALALSPSPLNGLFALSNAQDWWTP